MYYSHRRNSHDLTSPHLTSPHPFLTRSAVEWLDKAPALPGLPFSVLALGDRNYEHFAACGKRVDAALEKLGGRRVVDRVDIGEGRGWGGGMGLTVGVHDVSETVAQAQWGLGQDQLSSLLRPLCVVGSSTCSAMDNNDAAVQTHARLISYPVTYPSPPPSPSQTARTGRRSTGGWRRC